MENLVYNPRLTWHNMPESIEYIKILQEQGVSTFDPVKFYNEAKIQEKTVIDMDSLTRKERKKIKKNKISKSGQKIIDNNNKKKEVLLREEEERKLDFLIDKCNDIDSMAYMLNKMRTNYGRISAKIKLLELSISKSYDLEMHLLFFALKDEIPTDELKNDFKAIILKYKSLFKDKDLIEIQMTKLSSYLHPLNPLNKQKRKLDDWQVEVFERIEKKQNILIVAPTSAGKTVCSTYCAVVGKKTLFVVPSDELARQVAGIFRNMANIMIGIVTNKEYYMDTDVNVVVGTPKKLEEYLTLHYYDDDKKCDFDYAIYDEIQMLNSEEGSAFENIIKLLECPLLALSATIEKPNELKGWLETVKGKEVFVVEYNKRFIVQQRYLWDDNKLCHLHPISCLDIEFIKTENFLKSELSFTPRDTYHLYKTISSKVDNTSEIKPHNILSKGKWDQINLNDTILVEKKIKKFLSNLADENPNILQEILDTYKADENFNDIDIIELIKTLISKNMCPTIFFKIDAFKCRTIFKYVVNELERRQNEKYPYHYDDMKLIYDSYCEFNNTWKNEQEKIKIPKDTDPVTFMENVKKRLAEKQLNDLKNKYQQIIYSRNLKIQQSEMEQDKKVFYLNYYNQELNKVLEQSELMFVDKNMPHPEFTFNHMGVDSNMMRGIRRNLRSALGYDVKYSHPIMIGIERGIVPYFKDMETPFQRIVQSLFSQKKIPVIISDESLGYGINMPIRTVVMLGEETHIENVDTLVANQMSGRSGRRGVDREGNIVYAGVNWKTILKGSYTDLIGRNPSSITLPLPIYFNKLKGNDIDRLFKKTLHQFVRDIDVNNKEEQMSILNNNKSFKSCVYSEIMWVCRYLGNNINLLPDMLKYLARKKDCSHVTVFKAITILFDNNGAYEDDLQEDLGFSTETLYNCKELLGVYQEKRIVDVNKTHNILNRLKVINIALSAIDTVICRNKFKILCPNFKKAFFNLKDIIVKYQF